MPENSIQNPEILKCRLLSDKKWTALDLELQKIKDDVDNLVKNDLRAIRNRLDRMDIIMQDIQKLSSNVGMLSQNMHQMLEEIKNQNTRINTLEQKPVKRFDSILDTIIKLVITAAVGVLLVKIGLA